MLTFKVNPRTFKTRDRCTLSHKNDTNIIFSQCGIQKMSCMFGKFTGGQIELR